MLWLRFDSLPKASLLNRYLTMICKNEWHLCPVGGIFWFCATNWMVWWSSACQHFMRWVALAQDPVSPFFHPCPLSAQPDFTAMRVVVVFDRGRVGLLEHLLAPSRSHFSSFEPLLSPSTHRAARRRATLRGNFAMPLIAMFMKAEMEALGNQIRFA